jgi:aconitate hydratase
VVPSLAGPKRPQDRVALDALPAAFDQLAAASGIELATAVSVHGADHALRHGDVVIAAITSCTNTSNPSVMMAAGLLAKKAVGKGLGSKPWVKTSLAPGSQVVTDYLAKAGLLPYLEKLGFSLVGYGCTTCIGNSGPLPTPIASAIDDNDLLVSAVLSGNRNFEGRVHPQVKANWLASPPLVVAFALAGHTRGDIASDALGVSGNGQPVSLRDIWPSPQEIAAAVALVDQQMFRQRYADVFHGDDAWRRIAVRATKTYEWQAGSTYVRNPPYFEHIQEPLRGIADIEDARVLALFGDSITTDHISPAGTIEEDSPAAAYLVDTPCATR